MIARLTTLQHHHKNLGPKLIQHKCDILSSQMRQIMTSFHPPRLKSRSACWLRCLHLKTLDSGRRHVRKVLICTPCTHLILSCRTCFRIVLFPSVSMLCAQPTVTLIFVGSSLAQPRCPAHPDFDLSTMLPSVCGSDWLCCPDMFKGNVRLSVLCILPQRLRG